MKSPETVKKKKADRSVLNKSRLLSDAIAEVGNVPFRDRSEQSVSALV